MIKCEECNVEFTLEYEEVIDPEFCPFCGERMDYSLDEEEEFFEDDD